MVLGPQGPGRVGRRRLFLGTGRPSGGPFCVVGTRWPARPATARLAPVVQTARLAAAPARATERPRRAGRARRLRAEIRAAIDPFGEHIPDGPGWRCASTSAASSADPGFLAAVERASGRAAGLVPVRGGRRPPGERELGYRLRPDAWGQGYATEGAAALLRDALRPAGRRARLRPRAARQPGLDPRDGEDRHDLRRPVGLPRAAGRRVRGAGAQRVRRRDAALNDRGPLPMGGPDRSWRPSQAAQRAKGCALRCRGCARWGVTQQWVRAGTVPAAPGPHRCAQGRAVRMGRGDVDGTVRARARGGRIRAAGPEVAGGGAALERGEGDGQVDGAPDGRAP